ncbi:hypothetical protein DL98DRAFT_537248 [Cadophora sp. DSE1049]|nr:hypothetical protein DL98DRAFT_537248 [Cadophora sp. DSE1049]
MKERRDDYRTVEGANENRVVSGLDESTIISAAIYAVSVLQHQPATQLLIENAGIPEDRRGGIEKTYALDKEEWVNHRTHFGDEYLKRALFFAHNKSLDGQKTMQEIHEIDTLGAMQSSEE